MLWENLDHFQVSLEFDQALTVPRVRERDKVLMEEAVEKPDRSEWLGVNRMRKKMKIYFLSQLAHCNGQIVRDTVVQGLHATPSMMEFSHEEPTAADIILWKKGTVYSHIAKLPFPNPAWLLCSGTTPSDILGTLQPIDNGYYL